MGAMVKCEKCGSIQDEHGAAFCYNCGAKLNERAAFGGVAVPPAPMMALPMNGAPAQAAPRKKNKAVIVLIVLGTLLVYALYGIFGYFFYTMIKKKVMPYTRYAIACNNAAAVYEALTDEMGFDNDSFFDFYYDDYYDPEKGELYSEVLTGGVYRCDTDGSGVQGIVYRAIKDSGDKDAEKGSVYVGFDRYESKLFVHWISDDGTSLGQCPDPPPPDNMNELTFGEFCGDYGDDYYRYGDDDPYYESPRERGSSPRRQQSRGGAVDA